MKLLLSGLGLISLSLGVIGIFLPLLPTTPFLLLSAFLFAKSSDKLYNWLLNHKILGRIITNFRDNKSIPLKTKILSITVLWSTMSISIFYFVNELVWLQLLLILIALGVSYYILSLKTLNERI